MTNRTDRPARTRPTHRRALTSAAVALVAVVALAGCASDDEPAGEVGSAPVVVEGSTSSTVGPDAVATTAELRPVLVLHADASTAPPEALADAAGMAYELAPALPAGAVESATAIVMPTGDWAVALVFANGSPGIDDLNALAVECETMTAACPTGQLAVVLGRAVLSAPMLLGGPFEADAIQISGLDEANARQLAAALG